MIIYACCGLRLFGRFAGQSLCSAKFINFAGSLSVESPGVTREVENTFIHMQNS